VVQYLKHVWLIMIGCKALIIAISPWYILQLAYD